MNEAEFHLQADRTLAGLAEMLEKADLDGLLDAEYANGTLTVELPSGKQFLLSKHTPNRQLWLASPLSGGLHFSFDAASRDWRLPDGRKLSALFREELFTLGKIVLP